MNYSSKYMWITVQLPGMAIVLQSWWSSPACIPVLTAAWASLTAPVICRNGTDCSGLENSDLCIYLSIYYLLEHWTRPQELCSVTNYSSCFERVIRAGISLKQVAAVQLFCCLKRMTASHEEHQGVGRKEAKSKLN